MPCSPPVHPCYAILCSIIDVLMLSHPRQMIRDTATYRPYMRVRSNYYSDDDDDHNDDDDYDYDYR